MNRRTFLKSTAVAGSIGFAHSVLPTLQAEDASAASASAISTTPQPLEEKDGFVWYDVAKLPVEGRAWEGEERLRDFDRFPKRWMEKIPVRGLAQHSAGMAFRFVSNATGFQIDYDLLSGGLAMYHMPATGVSGFDLYARDDTGKFRFVDMRQKGKTAKTDLGSGMESGPTREFLIYFPLYNGVNSFKLGVPKTASFALPQPRTSKPILFYGTSILHGGCASRSGLAYPSQLCRRLDVPHWNFGFSGSGKMEPVMGDAFAELDPSLYVLDCVWNMNNDLLKANVVPFVEKIRAAHPETPILMVEDSIAPCSWINPGRAKGHADKQAIYRAAFDELQGKNIGKLYYLEGEKLSDPEGTVDNCHPNDLGFLKHVNAFEPVVRDILNL